MTLHLVPLLLCLCLSLIVLFGLIIFISLIEKRKLAPSSLLFYFSPHLLLQSIQLLIDLSLSSKGLTVSRVIFLKCRALHYYSTLNCPVAHLHLYMAFPAQLLHIPVIPFSDSQVLLSTHISWTVLCSFPKFWFIFQKLSLHHASNKALQSLSPSEPGSSPVCILTVCPTLISHVCSS